MPPRRMTFQRQRPARRRMNAGAGPITAIAGVALRGERPQTIGHRSGLALRRSRVRKTDGELHETPERR